MNGGRSDAGKDFLAPEQGNYYPMNGYYGYYYPGLIRLTWYNKLGFLCAHGSEILLPSNAITITIYGWDAGFDGSFGESEEQGYHFEPEGLEMQYPVSPFAQPKTFFIIK